MLSDKEIAEREREKYGCDCDIERELKACKRPLHMKAKPMGPIRPPQGLKRTCRNWDTEAAMRMLMNNLSPELALRPDELVVYGGAGRAVRNWHEYRKIIDALKNISENETLCVQSGKAVFIADTHPLAPRVIIANSNLVPHWSGDVHFDEYDRMGLTMYGQMTAGSWIYIGTQGILQGTYETFSALARKEFSGSLEGKFVLSSGLGGMSGAQPRAVTFNDGIILCIEARKKKVRQKYMEKYCDSIAGTLDAALRLIKSAKKNKKSISIGLVGNAAEIYPELVRRGEIPDVVTDQTPAHDLSAYIPIGDLAEVDSLKRENPGEYKKRVLESIYKHVEAILEMKKQGTVAFEYGNNLRARAEQAGLKIRDKNGKFLYPGFVPAYIRDLFCEGRGPFRWAALSGRKNDIFEIDKVVLELFSQNMHLKSWIEKAREKVPLIGIPARICWLGHGEREKFACEVNRLVEKREIGPIVFGRDHLDCGSVASPNRETEDMIDGSDAIADWPLIGFALNAANGASWVSFHNGGGVGIGYALHEGMVIVADGKKERYERLERVLSVETAKGIVRHADAGYEKAKEIVKRTRIKIL